MTTQSPALSPFVVVVDTREQLPYTFAGLTTRAAKGRRPLEVPTVRRGLKTGDYTIVGMEDCLAVERKSKSDLYGSITYGRDRFKREHERLSGLQWAHVVVEASLADALTPPEGNRTSPRSVLGTIASWPTRYGVQWWFADNRQLAEILTYQLMEKAHTEWRQHTDESTRRPCESPSGHVGPKFSAN